MVGLVNDLSSCAQDYIKDSDDYHDDNSEVPDTPQWTLFQWGSKVSTNWSNTWKHACYCAFMYTFTEKHVCFHVMCT